MNLELAGKTVLITGASKGIGRACVETFAREGCSIIVVARDEERLGAVQKEVEAEYDVAVTVYPADLSDGLAVRDMVERFPDVDILVNNAGDIPGGSIEEIDELSWLAGWQLKVFGYINATRSMLDRMYAKRAGVIVNVIGMGAHIQSYEYAAGATGNAALVAFTNAVGAHSVDRGVRVVGVNPGAVDTDRWRGKIAENDASERTQSAMSNARYLYSDLPLGRPADPEEIADLVTFLASDRASYISGTVINIDCGMIYR